MKYNFFNYELIKEKRKVPKEQLKKEIEELEKNLAREIGITEIETFKGINHILWQIHFAEIFDENLNFGFDICIANPPYLRQEKINELFKTFESGVTKDELVDAYENLYANKKVKIAKNSDLYVYFFLRGINLLKEKGVLCFICSNSWLDVGYGKTLQEILLKTTRIKAIYDNSAKRSFEKADVNTTINVFIKDSSVDLKEGDKNTGRKKSLSTNNISRFVVFKDEFEKTALSSEINRISLASQITTNNTWRVYPIQQNELYQNALDEDLKFEGDKWGGKYLRAPDIFFTIVEKGKDKLFRLRDIAEVKFGIKTGVNEFFYLSEDQIAEWKIENRFLKPAILSPKESYKLFIIQNDFKYKLLMCHQNKDQLIGTNVLKYIKWGESQDFDKRPSVSGRNNWYDLGKRKATNINCNYLVNEIMRFYSSEEDFFVSDNFLEIHYKNKNYYDHLVIILNSSLFALMVNIFGRANFGGGLMKIQTYEVANQLMVDPRLIKLNTNVKNALKSYGSRNLTSFLDEFGLNSLENIRGQKLTPLPDRKALDEIVFDALGLTKAEREEVYYAVCELVQNRLNKARSV